MDWDAQIPSPPSRDAAPLRIGVVRSFFARPLVYGLDALPDVLTPVAHEAALAECLLSGEVGCALLPVMGFARQPRGTIIPGIGLCSRGASASEVLLTHSEPRTLKRVGFDSRKGDADALARVVLAEGFGATPEFFPVGVGDEGPRDLDGMVVSGEEAFGSEMPFPQRYDLGAEWQKLTGYPFVHRIWIAHARAPLPELRQMLSKAYRDGEEHLESLAAEAGEGFGEAAAAHVRNTLRYTLGTDEVEGMHEFFRLAATLGLCDKDIRVVFC